MTDELNLDNLSSALLGGTFLRNKNLIIPLLHFVNFKNSNHYLVMLSTYFNFFFIIKNYLKNFLLKINKFICIANNH